MLTHAPLPPLLPLLLLVGCGQPKTKAPLTQGLPASTNVWAQLSLVADSKQANKASADFLQGLEALIQANPEARRNLAKLNEVLGAIKDAGFGDLAKGDLKSVTLGATLPKNAALIGPSPADLQLVLILRGNFNPARLAEFAKNNNLKQTEVGGAPPGPSSSSSARSPRRRRAARTPSASASPPSMSTRS